MEVEKDGPERTRTEVGKAVNDMLLINALKHFNRGEDGTVEVDDLDESALAAILKAMANYVVLAGKKKTGYKPSSFGFDRISTRRSTTQTASNRNPKSCHN